MLFFVTSAAAAQAAPVVRSAAGANAAAIQAAVDAFRSDLGTLNPNNGTTPGTGRREINWDGVPDAFASPAALPANFFNSNSPRGVVFSTSGTGFLVSRTAAQGDPEFSDIDPSYAATFGVFSPQRLFTPSNGTTTDVHFFVPTANSTTAALTRGFGAVFTDVDTAGAAQLQFFDTNGTVIWSGEPPLSSGSAGLSFLGTSLPDGPGIARVRITSGKAALGAGVLDGGANDLVVLDDFIYAEPTQDSGGGGGGDGGGAGGPDLDGDGIPDDADTDDDGDGVSDADAAHARHRSEKGRHGRRCARRRCRQLPAWRQPRPGRRRPRRAGRPLRRPDAQQARGQASAPGLQGLLHALRGRARHVQGRAEEGRAVPAPSRAQVHEGRPGRRQLFPVQRQAGRQAPERRAGIA